ncbi:MAG TPA: MgtC/SapB family protein [Bryobacteraceae bacterium]|jgi:putative Mg2+ transporter-C (MgtC) family protein
MTFSIDWQNETVRQMLKLMAAYALALPVGWWREKEAHTIGVRTFPLVAMASCGYILVAVPLGHPDPTAQSRVLQGLVAGIGFIGGGAILKAEGNVHGTATAASIWNTGVLGAAVAEDRFFLAAVLALLNFFTLRVLLPFKERIDAKNDRKTAASLD